MGNNLKAVALSTITLALVGCAHPADKGNPGGPDLGIGGGGGGGGGGSSGTDGGSWGSIVIAPLDPVVQVMAGQTPPTVQFTATVNGLTTMVNWTIDRGEIGGVDGNGLFSTPGNLAGKAHVTAMYGSLKATTSVTVQITNVQTHGDPAWTNPPQMVGPGGYGGVGGDGPGGPPSGGQVGTLNGTATTDPAVSLLYPYDQTVWPRGLLAPLVQWNAGSHHFDSAYVHIQEKNFEYKGYFAANNPANFVNLPLPQQVWSQLTYSNSGDPVTVSITFAEGNAAYGPYQLTWKIAPATLKGTIYYNSYGTYLVKNSASDGLDQQGSQYGAGTLAIKPGATSPVLVAGYGSPIAVGPSGCRVCHTVSANGTTLLTQGVYDNGNKNLDYSSTRSIYLLNDTTGGSGTALATPNLAFPALSPDGKMLFSSEGSGGIINGNSSIRNSQLYDVASGNAISSVGLPQPFQVQLPSFSPDGQHISFNFWNGAFPTGPIADKASLTILDFNPMTRTFSNPQRLYTPPTGTAVAYSSFLPTSAAVVFSIQLKSTSNAYGFTWGGITSELWWADVASKQAHRLDQLNGVNLPNNGATGTHPAGLDTTLNYEPTVNPIASGGYAWVVFTSRRMYGNVATADPWMSDPRNYNANAIITDKKLWVAAIDLNAAPGTDPSHPAFYLPAQEIHAGNSRGYWTVDPCHADGTTCMTGDECCGGYCQAVDGGLVCSSTMPMCAAEFEKCNQTSDCCGAAMGITCVNNVCSQNIPG